MKEKFWNAFALGALGRGGRICDLIIEQRTPG